MKKVRGLIFLLLIIITSPVFSQQGIPPMQTQPWWLSLELGKQRFRSGDYGRALLLFEDARRNRRAMYEQKERDFINFLSLGEVRRIGDSLEILERFSRDRYYTAASAALDELFHRVPRASLNNSANKALEAFDKLKNYPEAEFWIGEIFRIEGNLSMALAQYRRAYSMREQLEDPGFAVELLYKIAGVLLVRQEYNEMIRVLNSIIVEHDTLWTSTGRVDPRSATANAPIPVPHDQMMDSFISQAMTTTLQNNGIGRFLELYRYNNKVVEPAHRQLGFFYIITGRQAAQRHLMFAFLIQNTVIIEEIMRQRFDFNLTNPDPRREDRIYELKLLAEEINKNPILLAYVNEVEYFKTAYYLAVSLHLNGRLNIARDLWAFLAAQPQAGEWHSRAVMQLHNPRLYTPVEMP